MALVCLGSERSIRGDGYFSRLMADPIATVVIPNYNGLRHLPALLESLEGQTDSRFTITIVDDVSTDESVAYLQKQWPQVRLVCNERNIGFAGSCNAGLRLATTPFVVLLNNDTHVDPHWLAEGLRPFDQEEVAAVASLVLLADPPHLIDTAGRRLFGRRRGFEAKSPATTGND